MNKMNPLQWIAWILVVIGGLNWGLVGFFEYDVVAKIFGAGSTAATVIYDLVGLAAIIMLLSPFMGKKQAPTA